MNDTYKPDRLPMDGSRTDGFALTDAPVYLEHGDEANGDDAQPTLGLDFTMFPSAALVVGTDPEDYPEPLDGVLECIERTLAEAYAERIPEGYGVDVQLSGDGFTWDRVNNRPEVYITVEMWGGPYRDGESTEDWIMRTTTACRYWTIVNEMWTFYTGQRMVEAALRKHLGLPAACPLCCGSREAWDGGPCRECDGTGDAPD